MRRELAAVAAVAAVDDNRDGAGATTSATTQGATTDPPPRKRPRKSAPSSSTILAAQQTRSPADALDTGILTLKVWEAVFEIFQLHFATLLPFIHPPTFLAQIRTVLARVRTLPDAEPHRAGDGEGQTVSPIVLLGVLTLTAKFHPQLVSIHGSGLGEKGSDPTTAAEYFATALKGKLTAQAQAEVDRGGISMERVQGLLMLALHEWGMCRGLEAWFLVGEATRTAQAMGLQFEADQIDHGYTSSAFRSMQADVKDDTSEGIVRQEVERRTFWGCMIMDRLLSSGRYRPSMVSSTAIEVQLPCSERAFTFGERVLTSRLHPAVDQRFDATLQDRNWDRTERGPDEGAQGRVIRLIDIWSDLARWIASGGLR